MKLNFKQGIVRRQTDIANNPTFLQKHSLSGDYIDLIVSPDPTILNFSHRDSNYTIEENKTILKAWGPVMPIGQTQWLYWDISLLDGALTRGYTILPLLITSSEPLAPSPDQHWFDLNTNQWKVWNGHKWIIKVRCFAAEYDSSAIILPYPIGSQVGLNGINISAGNILLGKNDKPLRHIDGTFLTTEDQLIAGRNNSSPVSFDAQLVHAQAAEYIPEYSLVSFVGPDRIGLASHLNITRQVNGIVIEDLYLDEVGRVITHGTIQSSAWSWSTSMIGKPLFCGPTGQVTLSVPPVGISQQIGIIQDIDTIYLNIMIPIIL